MIDLERKNPQWLYAIDDDEKTAIRGSFKSLVESFNSIKKDVIIGLAPIIPER